MDKPAWSAMTDDDTAARRAAGRRAYNARRKLAMAARLKRLAELLRDEKFERGYQSRLAERLGVTRATVSNDIRRLRGAADRVEIHQVEKYRRRHVEPIRFVTVYAADLHE